jgi:hypothetical protein
MRAGCKCAGRTLILKELFGTKSTEFEAFSRYIRERFIDSKRVKWRTFGEMSHFFCLIISCEKTAGPPG